MCHLLIFESNVKGRESWYLSGKILYFLEARMCYLLKIASWSAWKAVPIWLSPVGSSCVCDMLYCFSCFSQVNMFISIFWTSVPTAVPIPVVTRSVSLLVTQLGVWSSSVRIHLRHAQRHVLSLVCFHQACSSVPSHFGLASVWSHLPVFPSHYKLGLTLHVSLQSMMYCKMWLVSCLRCAWKRALSFWSILWLVLSVLIWCLFLNSALAVRGRRLMASGISSHSDAVLSVFVSQCTWPHFLVDESRVPVCAGSNSVSFQHPTLLWDGRKSDYLPVLFFTWGLLLRIYQLPVIPR